MSLISRSSRRTSCWMTASSRALRFRLARDRQSLDGAAQRGQRIFQFVGDVGGETFDRVHAIVERFRHVAQRAGQMADFVAAIGEIRNFLARFGAAADPLGRFREPAHRLGDGAGEEQRQEQHDRGRDQEDADDRPAFRGDDLVDVAALRRKQKRAADGAEKLDRHRDRDDRLALGVDPHNRLRLPSSACATSG